MHDYALLRESLMNISRWRGKRVVVHADAAILNKEKYMSPIIRDVMLLNDAGIDVTFSCVDDDASVFVEKAESRGANVILIRNISDIIRLAARTHTVKVIFLCEGDGIYDRQHHLLLREMTTQEAESMLSGSVVSGSMAEKVRLAVRLCDDGVRRVHLVNGRKEGALLDEFLSSKGSGTMIYHNDPPYKMVRKAVSDDAVGIAHMIRDTVDSSIVEEVILQRVDDCAVFVVDEQIHAAVLSSCRDGVIRVEYLAHSTEFNASEVLYALLCYIIDGAAQRGGKRITVDPGKVPILIGIWPWFLKLGFRKVSPSPGNTQKLWEKTLS